MKRPKSSRRYKNRNKPDKTEINERIAGFDIPNEGLIILLDHEDCASTQAIVAKHGPSIIPRIRLPQTDALVAQKMRQGPYASCVIDTDLHDYLYSLEDESIALLYADFFGGIEETKKLLANIHFFDKLKPCAYLAVTVCLRSYNPVQFEKESLFNMTISMVQQAMLGSLWLFPDIHPNIYGTHVRMATQYFYLWGKAAPGDCIDLSRIPWQFWPQDAYLPLMYRASVPRMISPVVEEHDDDTDSIATTPQFAREVSDDELDRCSKRRRLIT